MLVVALLELIAEGDLRPTAGRIAERAGVCPRSLYHHFPDRELLFAAALERQRDQASTAGGVIEPGASLSDRLAGYVERRARSCEMLRPILLASLAWEPFSDTLGAALAALHLDTRREIERTFAPELSGLGPAEQAGVLAMLVAAADCTTWETLRNQQGLTVSAARDALQLCLSELLSGRTPKPSGV
jgi:AcrR family transcriptional regulator